MKLKKLAHLIALIGVTAPAFAQEAPPQTMQRVEITGSSIKRIAKEGALPVEVISAEQMQKMGVTSAEDLVRTLSANGTGADNATSSNNVFGSDADRVAGGASFASLRGLGANSTLVLLNGRRIAAHGASGASVDLNSIPTAAIQRVEILKDGASAIYGTDAVGGVINFILRKNYEGVQASVMQNHTQEGGGALRRYSLLAGTGDLDADGFNLMASLTFDNNDKLSGNQRSFNNGYQPARGLSPDTTGTPFANHLPGTGTALGSGFFVGSDPTKYTQANLLSFQGQCDSIAGMSQYETALWANITSPVRTRYSCSYDYGADYAMLPPVERTNLLARGSFKLSDDHTAFVELTGSRTDVISELTAMQISTSIASGSAYPVGGAYYQDLSAYISTFDNTKPIAYKWRANDFGKRTQQRESENIRLLTGIEGVIGGWDYKAGVSQSRSSTDISLVDGYAYTTKLNAALGTGLINPWLQPGQTQTAEANALIQDAKFSGLLQGGKTTLTQVDGSVSGTVMDLPAGPLGVAAGFDLRRESYEYFQYADSALVTQAPGNNTVAEKTRDVKALYTEVLVPVTKDLELQLALRHDDYSDVGSTTNPKVAFRYQPAPSLLFRGSVNTGFLAPSFQNMYSGTLEQELSSGADDPVYCPSNPGDPRYCAVRMDYRSGGNPDLRPEKSKQATLGVVFEPIKAVSVSLDWWRIDIEDRILKRKPQDVLANYQTLSEFIIRNADGTINYIQAGMINAAKNSVRGVDLGVAASGKLTDEYKWTASLNGTYVDSFTFQEYKDKPAKEYVGKFFTRDLQLRWKHNLNFGIEKGDWNTTLSQRYSSGYKDQVPNKGATTPPPGFNPDVEAYVVYDWSATYKGIANTTLTVGIQNLLNTDPPFTAHNVDDVVGAGWDPRVANPRGRAFWFNAKYDF